MIGINRYQRWPKLNNAVNDARGVLVAFQELGFTSIVAPLFDGDATGNAVRCLPSNLKGELKHDDSLVVFFAGHGHTTKIEFADGPHIKKGYLIPVDADHDKGFDHTWQSLDSWLTSLAELPPRHILVILDSCFSGIALSPNEQYRGVGARADASPVPPHRRLSRRVLTSALNDQRAMDCGPISGHSVFTGHLIEALRGKAIERLRDQEMMGVEDIALYVRHHVQVDSGHRQDPVQGRLAFDDHGDFRLLPRPQGAAMPPPPEPGGARGDRVRPAGGRRRPPVVADPLPSQLRRKAPESRPEFAPHVGAAGRSGVEFGGSSGAESGLPDRTEGWVLDAALAGALDRHGKERRHGAQVLTVVAGDALAAQTSWGTWAARHGYLTLATLQVEPEAVVADLLAQTPWLRCVPEARKRLAAAAGIDVQAVDAALDARSVSERRRWIEDVASLDPHARVSGWLLSSLRRPAATIPDLSTAPVRHGELLAIACDLASPTAVLLFSPKPDEPWLEQAIITAVQLIGFLPGHSVAVTAPADLVTRVLDRRRSGAAWVMARQGRVNVEPLGQRLPGRARHSTMRVLCDALSRDPRTRGQFELDGTVETADGSRLDVGLVARAARIAVELDAWYHFHDPEGYRRDRVQDTRLQRAGYFVLRFPAEDVDDRLAATIEQLAIALASRRAVRALPQETLHGSIS